MEKIKVFYDKEADMLEVLLAKPQESIAEEIDPDIFVHRNPKTNQVVSYTILGFVKRFSKPQKNKADLVVELKTVI